MAVCYCGTHRAAVEAQAEREKLLRAPAFPWLLVPVFAAMVVAAYLASTRGDAPSTAAPPAERESPAVVALQPPPAVTERAEGYAIEAPQVRPTQNDDRSRLPPPTPTPTPSPIASPTPERTDTEIQREEGERRLEQTLARLKAEMARLAANARTFESICLSTRGERISCEGLFDDISSSDENLGRGLDEAEDKARRAQVLPGVIRDLRHKYGLEDSAWADLTSTVRRLKAEYRGEP